MKFLLRTTALLFLGITPLAAQTPMGGADITYSLPRAAKVSLNVLDSKGWIVRELLRADQEDAGAHTVRWDGNDAFGRPVPPGNYTWKLLHHTGLNADYVLSVGCSGQPPYRTDDDKGSWGACHGNPLSVRADASGLYLTWGTEEGNAVFAHTDYDGLNLYKIHNSQGWGRNYDSVIVGETLYRLEAGATGSFLEKYDVKTGKFTNWDAKDARISGGKLRIQQEPIPIPDKKAPKDPNAKPTNYGDAQAIAANANYVAASFPNLNKIALVRPTGEALPDLQIDQPHGLLFLPDGRLLIAQPGRVVAIKLEDPNRKPVPFLAQNLDNPWGLALAADGESLWITDQGQSNQVKQFSLDGKLLKAFGKPGGMQMEGEIDFQSFYKPQGIACGTDGNIYVTENSPLRRISRWSTGGKLLREWFGPEGPQRSCWPNLNDFSEVYYHSSTDGFIQCKVDLEKKTWHPVAWSQLNIGKSQPYVFESHGRKFLYNGLSSLFVYDAKAGHWLPAVKFDTLDKEKQASIWTDLNGNGQADDGETQVIATADLTTKTNLNSLRLGFAQFDLKTLAMNVVAGADVARFEPGKFTDQGLPVYTVEKMRRLTQKSARGADVWMEEGIYSVHGAQPAADGGFFSAYNGGRQGLTRAWDRANWNYLVKFSADGQLQWQAGCHAREKKITNPADSEMYMRLAGMSKGILFLTDVEGKFHTYTDDGLYVDTLMDDGRKLTPNSMCVENVTGLIAEHPTTHEPYLFAGSTEDSRIWRITGFDSLQRMQGKVTLKTPEIAASASADTYTIAATKPPRKREANDFGADGFLNEPEWRQASELPLIEEGVVKGRIYLRHDDQYLWVGAHVVDSSPAVNSSQDAETAFTRGDCFDLYFGADPAEDAKRDTADVGDVRVLLYPQDKSSQRYNGGIVLYRMKVAPGAKQQPFEFASPAGSVAADSVTTLNEKDAVTGGGLCSFYRWPNGEGYTVEAKIPLTALPELGINAQMTDDHQIAFDAGVVFSNDTGNDRASRLYWHQQDSRTQMVMDLPSEAQFYPRLWGKAQIKSVIAPSR